MSDQLKRETYDSARERYHRDKDNVESREMWLELALLAEKGLPYPKTKRADADKKQMALERAILETEFLFGKKEDHEGISESNSSDEELGQLK